MLQNIPAISAFHHVCVAVVVASPMEYEFPHFQEPRPPKAIVRCCKLSVHLHAASTVTTMRTLCVYDRISYGAYSCVV